MSDQKEIQQGVKDLTSSLGGLLKNVGMQGSDAIAPAVNLLVAIAAAATATGVGAALGVVAAATGLLTTIIGDLSAGSTQTQAAEQKIIQLVQQFQQAQAADDRAKRVSDIQDQVAVADKVRAALPSLTSSLPLTPEEIRDNLENVAQAISALAPQDVAGLGCEFPGLGGHWTAPFNFQVFWDDSDSPDNEYPPIGVPFLGLRTKVGYGKQAPTVGSDGNVFNYIPILPAYLYAISVFISVGAVIDPKFTQNWGQTVIKPTTCLLQSVHDYILKQGLTQLSPARWDEQTLTELLNSIISPSPLKQTGIIPVFNPWPSLALLPHEAGASIEYGAVDKFSGYSSMGLYTLLASFTDPVSPYFPSGPFYYGKFQIRLLRRAKDVYRGTGLLSLFGVINSLKKIVGDPPLPGPRFSDWSFRWDIIPNTNIIPTEPVHLRDVVKYIEQTPPADVPRSLVISFRNLLSV
jgi:hypothetical protein